MKSKLLLALLLCLNIAFVFAGPKLNKTDANIVGHVVSEGKHVPFVNIAVKGTAIGTVTDETGLYYLVNMPEGEFTIIASSVGYKTVEKKVVSKKGLTVELKFEMVPDVLGLDEVVVTGSRSAKKRTEAPVIVNSLNPDLFVSTQSVTFGEGLNFTPGLRTENNCSNCGFTQVRMNGMEGPYSQILINGRAIFSGLAGVYGLELIPANIIEKVEVVRGGGSAIYGSNAIAGTINMILKDPIKEAYEIAYDYSAIGTGLKGSGGVANDHSIKFNATVVSDDFKTGVSVYGFNRNRNGFDANGDGYTELTELKNTTIGTRATHRFGYRSKIAVDFFHVEEKRRGGNKLDYTLHESDIAEFVEHEISSGAITFEQFIREEDKLSIYTSGQQVLRDSYYGANYSLDTYGKTKDFTHNTGIQYNAVFKETTLVSGIEFIGSNLKDLKQGYLQLDSAIINNDLNGENSHVENALIADQRMYTIGAYSQYEIKIKNVDISLGGRIDKYQVKDLVDNGKNENFVFSPRVNLLYHLMSNLQTRLSYSQGYRAPQIFDEDLHIETSASRRVIHQHADDLKQETSHSFMGSVEYSANVNSWHVNILAEGFYTRLIDPFTNDYGDPDEDGNVIYTRMNAEGGATVSGLNTELMIKSGNQFTITSGFTFQKSIYDDPQEDFNETHFFRSPNTYGYAVIDWDFIDDLCLSFTGNYTGKMLLPYFGDVVELRQSKSFFDLGLNLRYNVKFNGASIQFTGGIKNILNSYQNDHEFGKDKDPGYIYGPGMPRTIYFGIKLGNLLK